MNKINKKLLGLCIALASFLPFQVCAQSSGIRWRDGDVLTANKLQSLDDAKMNLSSLGLPGYAAKLDANKNVTSPLLNNARVGGSDTGTDLSAANVTAGNTYGPQISATNNLNTLFSVVKRKDPDIWISGNDNLVELTPENTRFVRATGRMSMSMSNSSISAYSTSDLQSIWSTFADTPNSIGLIKNTKWLPDQPDYRIPVTSVGTNMGAALGFKLTPGKQEIDLNGEVVARDDGNGHLVAVAGNGQGTVDYTNGIILYQFKTPTTAQDKIWGGFSMADGYGSHAIPSTWWTVMDQSPDGDTAPDKIQQLGYKPVVMLVNENGCTTNNGNTAMWCDMTVSDLRNTLADVQKIAPSIKYVFPYISPNAGVFGNFDTDAYWAAAKQGALQQGGFAIDMPAAFFLDNSEEYRQFVVQMIQWAHKNGVVVICEITPGGADNSGRDFLTDMRNIVSYLKDNNAVPNVWYDDQYGRAVSPVTDDLRSPNYKTDSTLAVARWLADTVGSFDLPDDKVGYMNYGTLTVPAPNTNASGATRETLGEMFSELGSMAYQPQDNVHITGGDLNDMWAMNIKSGAQFRFGSDGTTPVPFIGDGKGSVTVGGNIVMLGGSSIALGGAGGAGAGEAILRGQTTDHFMHLYNPFTTDAQYVGMSMDSSDGTPKEYLHLDTAENLVLEGGQDVRVQQEMQVASKGTFTDPDPTVLRDAKFGNNGIAVRGGVQADNETLSGSLNFNNTNPEGTKSNGISFQSQDRNYITWVNGGEKGDLYIGDNMNILADGSAVIHTGNVVLTGTGTNGIQFQSADGSKSSWIKGDTGGGISIGNFDFLPNSDLNIGTNNIVFSNSGVNGLEFRNNDGTKNSWLIGDGAGGIDIGSAINIGTGSSGTATMNNGIVVNNNLFANVHELSLGEFNTVGGNTQIAFYTGGDARATRTANMYTSGGYTDVPNSAVLNVDADKWVFLNMPIEFDKNSDTTGAGVFEANEYAFKENDTYMTAFGRWGWQIKTPAHTGIAVGATPVDAQGNMAYHPTSNSYIALNGHYFYVHDANGNIFEPFRIRPDGAQFFTKLYGITPTDSDYGTTYATTEYVKSKVAPTVVTFANLPANPTPWQQVICTDCYVTAGKVGVMAMYNPTSKIWTGVNGDAISH